MTCTWILLLAAAFSLCPSDSVMSPDLYQCNSTRLQVEISDLRNMVNEQNFQLQQSSSRITELRTLVTAAEQRERDIENNLVTLRNEINLQYRRIEKYENKCKRIGQGLAFVTLETGKYYFSGFRMSWYAAMRFCKQKGLELASVSDDLTGELLGVELRMRYEQNGIKDSKDWWWLSGSDIQTEDQYFWLSTGLDVDWDSLGQFPSDREVNDTYCTILVRGGNLYRMNTKVCTTQAKFICEMPAFCVE